MDMSLKNVVKNKKKSNQMYFYVILFFTLSSNINENKVLTTYQVKIKIIIFTFFRI